MTTCQADAKWVGRPCRAQASATWVHHGTIRVPVCDRHSASLRRAGATVVAGLVEEEPPLD